MIYEFEGGASPDRRAAVEERVASGEKVRLNYRRGMGGGLNAIAFDFKAYTKTTPTYAAQMPENFEVDTLEGTMRGKAGDYLAIGAHGEMYPIDRAVFESTYREAGE